MTMQRAAQMALDVQDACNLSGVLYTWARVMEFLCKESQRLGKGTDWRNGHPINVLFASKVESLTHCDSPATFGRAYDEVHKLVEAQAA